MRRNSEHFLQHLKETEMIAGPLKILTNRLDQVLKRDVRSDI